MFIGSADYKNVITSILENEGDILMAVAFWGADAERLIKSRCQGTRIKMICNLRTGGTNPTCIENLHKERSIIVKQHDRLHAKVIIGSGAAVVGSANLSSNGLGFEGNELKGWVEAGWVTRDSVKIESIRKWFMGVWLKSRDVLAQDIVNAKIEWARRRQMRPLISSKSRSGFSIEDFTLDDLSERRVFIVMYSDYELSEEAIKVHRKRYKELTGQRLAGPKELPPCYEGWPNLPREAQLIDIYCGPRRGLECIGVYVRSYDIKFKYKDGSKGHLAICRKEKDIMGQPFHRKDARRFVDILKPHIQSIWDSKLSVGDESGKYIHIAEAMKIVRSAKKM